MSAVNSQKFNRGDLFEVAGIIIAAANQPADKLMNRFEVMTNQKGSIL